MNKELLENYFQFLRIPSIGADPAHAKDMVTCCNWVLDYMKESGLDVEHWETPTHPVAYGSWQQSDGPTLLIYGHYDVQPVDPLDQWKSPPFEPEIRNGNVYARGAADNKGQILYALYAIRSLMKQHGKLPLNIKVLIEGEEETKSVGLHQILESRKEELKADYLLAPDSGMYSLEKPFVTIGLRGTLAFTVSLRGSRIDLHSGMAGGIVYNPNHALVELLSKLRDGNGKITVPGFYDNIVPLTEKEKQEISLDFDPNYYATTFQAETTGGERTYSPAESGTIRPTLEINGISGGYAGPGFKTVIPAVAQAKLSCRLVPDQDPINIYERVQNFLIANCPSGMELSFTYHGSGPAIRSNPNHPLCRSLAKAITNVIGKPCRFTLLGGSMPAMSALLKASGANPAYCGYVLPTDQIHAPNEHFGLDRMQYGIDTIVKLLSSLTKETS